MFSSKYYNRYREDYFDRKYYGARLKLKKFDTDEFQSISYAHSVPISEEDIEICVDVKDVSYHYHPLNPVLNKLSLQVPKGKIYALLGASGCGKTTLLRMMLGRIRPISGSIKVFGSEPGSKESNVPGVGVGYMPQELALFKLLTINEVMHYYGRLYGMERHEICEKVQKYITMLNLPEKNRQINQLSGGQQRRVSLAVTMIHSPPLLILDEPTVGVDSLLRCRIWSYLEELCANEGTTVLITTHYTEEARNAYRAGFIDSGTTLAEDNPQRLILKYNCFSLEDVFLTLCLNKNKATLKNEVISEEVDSKISENDRNNNTTNTNNNNNNNDTKNDVNNNNSNQPNAIIIKRQNERIKLKKSNSSVLASTALSLSSKGDTNSDMSRDMLVPKARDGNTSCNRLKALLKKNYILFRRNPASVIMLNVLPIMQLSLYCLTFNRNPSNIPVAIVNHDANSSLSFANLFLKHLDRKIIKTINYPSEETAIESIHHVKTWLAVSFPAKFSRNFKRRFTKPDKVTDKIINGSRISLFPDNSHSFFALYTYQVLMETFQTFVKEVGDILGLNPSFFGSPIQIEKPIYGMMNINYGEYISAGMVICILHGMSMLIGSFCIERELSEGHLERSFVAGVKPFEVVFSHIIFFIVPVITQVCLTLFLTFFVFQVNIVGSILDAFVLSLLQGLQGMLIGVTISVLCPTELASLMAVFIIEVPLIFTSGTLWPLESLSESVHNAMIWNPLTLPIMAMRSVMQRGWSLAHYSVMIGVMSSLSYSLLAIVLSLVFFQLINRI